MSAEEVYGRRVRDDMYIPQYDPGLTHDLMASGTRNMLSQIGQVNADRAANSREMWSEPGRAYQQYQQSKAAATENRRAEEQHGQNMALNQQNQELNTLKLSDARRMEDAAKARDAFLDSPLSEEEIAAGHYAPGKAPQSHRQAEMGADFAEKGKERTRAEEQFNLGQQATKASIAASGAQLHAAQTAEADAKEQKARSDATLEFQTAWAKFKENPGALQQANQAIATRYADRIKPEYLPALAQAAQSQAKANADQAFAQQETAIQLRPDYQQMRTVVDPLVKKADTIAALKQQRDRYLANKDFGGIHDSAVSEDARTQFANYLQDHGQEAAAQEIRGMSLSTVGARMERIIKAEETQLKALGPQQLENLNPEMQKRPEVAIARQKLGNAAGSGVNIMAITGGGGGPAASGANHQFLVGTGQQGGSGAGGYQAAGGYRLSPSQIQAAQAQAPQAGGQGAPGMIPLQPKKGMPGNQITAPGMPGAAPKGAPPIASTIGGGLPPNPDPLGLYGLGQNRQMVAQGVNP